MDKIKKETLEDNIQVYNDWSSFYNRLVRNTRDSYLVGKKETYEELLSLVSSYSKAGRKYIPASVIENIVSDKSKKKSNNSKVDEDDSDKGNSSSKHENKKKLYRNMNNDNDLFGTFNDSSSDANLGDGYGLLGSLKRKK